jgi:hypothetical protein
MARGSSKAHSASRRVKPKLFRIKYEASRSVVEEQAPRWKTWVKSPKAPALRSSFP